MTIGAAEEEEPGESAGSARRHSSQPAASREVNAATKVEELACCGGLAHCGYTRRSTCSQAAAGGIPACNAWRTLRTLTTRARGSPRLAFSGQLSRRTSRGQPARTSHWPAYADELVRSKLRGPTSSLRCTWQCVAARPSLQSSHLSQDGNAIQAARGPPR